MATSDGWTVHEGGRGRIAPVRFRRIGYQEIEGGMTEWRIDYFVRCIGPGEWALRFQGEDLDDEVGPMSARGFIGEFEERGLDIGQFIDELRQEHRAALTRLADEIEAASEDEEE